MTNIKHDVSAEKMTLADRWRDRKDRTLYRWSCKIRGNAYDLGFKPTSLTYTFMMSLLVFGCVIIGVTLAVFAFVIFSRASAAVGVVLLGAAALHLGIWAFIHYLARD